ncbi:hypothetical protein [Paenibacillus chitinolyticus]|uniref:hypothetical protein n=1 Tax=Paenibacillus chitinolyticus TaxID=79263 RepID=UPI00366D5B51
MKLKKVFSIIGIGTLVIASSANAATPLINSDTTSVEINQNEVLKKYNDFVSRNNSNLAALFENEDAKNFSLDRVNEIIESYYASHKEEVEEIKKNVDFLVDAQQTTLKASVKDKEVDLINYIHQSKDKEGYKLITKRYIEPSSRSLIATESNTGREVNILLTKEGGMYIAQSNYSEPSQSTHSISPLATEYRSNRIDIEAVNAIGLTTLTMYTKGEFSFERGVKAKATYGEGDYGRTFWGSSINVTNMEFGKFYEDPESGYAEVYSKMHVDSMFGFKGLGLVLNSDTVRIHVGCSLIGAISAGIRRN